MEIQKQCVPYWFRRFVDWGVIPQATEELQVSVIGWFLRPFVDIFSLSGVMPKNNVILVSVSFQILTN
jgi:hypothetical protein